MDYMWASFQNCFILLSWLARWFILSKLIDFLLGKYTELLLDFVALQLNVTSLAAMAHMCFVMKSSAIEHNVHL